MTKKDKKEIIVDERLAKEYARTKAVSLETARKNLAANFKKEAKGVNLSQQYDALIKAFRTMSPQLNGVVMREADTTNEIKSLRSKVSMLEHTVSELEERLLFDRDLFKQSMSLLNDIVSRDKKTIDRIEALENKKSIFARVWYKIKCLMS